MNNNVLAMYKQKHTNEMLMSCHVKVFAKLIYITAYLIRTIRNYEPVHAQRDKREWGQTQNIYVTTIQQYLNRLIR